MSIAAIDPPREDFVEILRYVDVLASVAAELRLEHHANRLCGQFALADERDIVGTIHRIASTSTHCAIGIREQLDRELAVKRAVVQQRTEAWRRLNDELAAARRRLGQESTSASVVAQEERLRAAQSDLAEQARRALRLMARLVDCRVEIDWCRAGIAAAREAANGGRPPRRLAYPLSKFADQPNFGRWLAEVVSVFRAAQAVAPERAQRLAALVARFKSDSATITFGGRFKSGKSSLLNAALGRPLLPTRDLPETGANCHISAGDRDIARIVQGERSESIPCDTESIRAAISLRGGESGTARASAVGRLELRLAGFPGGPRMQWIDPPGMFDRPEMTARAWQSADAADLMVWVFRSSQFLGESEAEAVAEFIARRGPASVVFIENAFLIEGVEDPWTYHLTQIAPVDRKKVEHLAADLGFPADQLPPLVVISAKKSLERGFGFGAGELRRLLNKLRDPNCSLIRRARLQWMHLELSKLVEEIEAKWRAAKDDNDKRASERDAAEKAVAVTAATMRSEFIASLVTEITACEERMIDSAASVVNAVVAAITPKSLQRDGTHEREVNAKLDAGLRPEVDKLIAAIRTFALRFEQSPPSDECKRTLRTLLLPGRIEITVPELDAKGGTFAAGAATGAVLGSFVPGVGTILGGLVGGIVGGWCADEAAVQQVCDTTQRLIRESVAQAMHDLIKKHSRRAAEVVLSDSRAAPSDDLPPIDRTDEKSLRELLERLDGAARETMRWFHREVVD